MKADAALSRKSAANWVVVSLAPDPVESARVASLRYVTDTIPGISRRKRGTGFEYIDPVGKVIRDPKSYAVLDLWRSHRLGARFGFVPFATATCKRPDATLREENSIVIIRAGARSETKTSMVAFWHSRNTANWCWLVPSVSVAR